MKMKFTERMKRILLAKLSPWDNHTECVAFVTPVEIKYLLSIGCKAERGQSTHYAEQAQKQIAIGDIYPSWFYFIPSTEIKKAVQERFTNQRHKPC